MNDETWAAVDAVHNIQRPTTSLCFKNKDLKNLFRTARTQRAKVPGDRTLKSHN